MNVRVHLFTLVFLVVLTIFVGVIGYSIIEKWDFLDSFYMTITTISSVGFGEVHPLTKAGKIFTVFLIMMGVGIVVYALTTIASILVEGKLNVYLRREKMERQINALKQHVIICGLQELTKVIVEEFRKTNTPFILIGKGVQEWIELTDNKDILYIEGNPIEEAILEKAGIKNASGIIVALEDDSQNVFIVLTARELNPNLRIVSEVKERSSSQKFLRAGADAVVCPDDIGGLRLASEIIRPTVVDFLDVMIKTKEAIFRIEEVTVGKDSSIPEKSLAEADLGKKTGVIVIAIKNNTTGSYKYNPVGHNVIKTGDTLIVLGSNEEVEILRNVCKG